MHVNVNACHKKFHHFVMTNFNNANSQTSIHSKRFRVLLVKGNTGPKVTLTINIRDYYTCSVTLRQSMTQNTGACTIL